MKAGHILAAIADKEVIDHFDQASDMYHSQPLTPETGAQKIYENGLTYIGGSQLKQQPFRLDNRPYVRHSLDYEHCAINPPHHHLPLYATEV